MRMRRILALLAMLFCAAPIFAQDKPVLAVEEDQSAPVKVVYHIDDTAAQALKALRNMHNQMDVAPKTKIVVVAHGDGVDFLFDGARDPKSNIEYGTLISALKAQGVRFEICQITMKRRNLSKDKFVMEADFTPSGVVRISELQFRDHYAYIKP
jgi:uncharacterized protein